MLCIVYCINLNKVLLRKLYSTENKLLLYSDGKRKKVRKKGFNLPAKLFIDYSQHFRQFFTLLCTAKRESFEAASRCWWQSIAFQQ